MDALINFLTNIGLPIAYILILVALGLSIVFPLVRMFTDFTSAKKALIGILGLAVLVIIGYALAGSDLPDYASDRGLSLGTFKLISAGITTAILAVIILVGYILVDIIIGLIKG